MLAQIHLPTVEAARALGWRAVPVGTEFEIDIGAFSIKGRSNKNLRWACNNSRTAGVTVRESPDTAELRQELMTLSDAWRQGKVVKDHEVRFISRPFVTTPEPDVRLFTAHVGDRLVAFAGFDPIYSDGRIIGYTADTYRAHPSAPEGATDFTIISAMDAFRAEGITRLSLGMAPAHHVAEIAKAHGSDRRFIVWLMGLIYRRGERIYNLKGIAFHKSRFRGTEVPAFAAFRRGSGLRELHAVMKLSGVV
jgi:phosphatidylglycerol lysyltransferase